MRRCPLYIIAVLSLALLLSSGKVGERQRFDGWYNNRANPDWAVAESVLLYNLSTAYGDFTYKPSGEDRPSPRLLSASIFDDQPGLPTYFNRTVLFTFFCQLVGLEIAHTYQPTCPVEILRILVPSCDSDFDSECSNKSRIPYERVAYDKRTGQSPNNPRKQLNKATSYIDGSFVYGNSEVWANILREWSTGKLKSSDRWYHFPAKNKERLPIDTFPLSNKQMYENPEKLWQLGNPHVHETPYLLSMGILLYRWHNHLAERFSKNGNLTAEQIFYKARSWLVASLQNIIMYEWLPKLLNESRDSLGEYSGYKSEMHPGLTSHYDAIAKNYYLTLLPPAVYRRTLDCDYLPKGKQTPSRICSCFWMSQQNLMKSETSVEEYILGMASQLAEREDHHVAKDFRGKYYGSMYFSRQDIVMQTIMKGRDYGLPDYNTARVELGLTSVDKWKDINPELSKSRPEFIEKLKKIHNGSLKLLDLFTGAMLETSRNGPGEIIRKVTKDQFLRIRDGDRFWFENTKNGLFTEEEIKEIRQIHLWDIIVNSTKLKFDEIQKDVFTWNEGDPCSIPEQVNETLLPPCPKNQGFDFFSGSEVSFITVWVLVAVFPGLCVLAAYICWKYKITRHEERKKKLKLKVDYAVKGIVNAVSGLHVAMEWIDHEESERRVHLKLDVTKCCLDICSVRGTLLRSINFNYLQVLTVVLSSNKKKAVLLIRIPKEYDAVFVFADEMRRKSFEINIKQMLNTNNKNVEWQFMKQKEIFAAAVTRKKRNKLLENFLKSVFSEAFHLDYNPGLEENVELNQRKEVLEFALTKEEFAEALAVRKDSDFVERMFALADTDQNNYISFRNFLNIVVLFSKGSCQDKLQIFFQMYNMGSDDNFGREQLTKLFRSLLDMVNSDLKEEDVVVLVESIIKHTGLEMKSVLSFEDFCQILSPQMDKLWNASIDWKGLKGYIPVGKKVTKKSVDIAAVPPKSNGMVRWSPETTSRHNFAATTEKYSPLKAKVKDIKRYLENNKQHIFFIIILYTVTFGVFAERFYYYSMENESSGLRQIMGQGLSVTRGAAAGMSFTFSFLLLTMCRNTITWLRSTFLNLYIPFDSHVAFHKLVAWTALFFTALHVLGYSFNFYQVATQPSKFLCAFQTIVFRAEFLPKFHWWLFGNIAGFTGVLLTIIICIIYVFATQTARKYIFYLFWLTHKLIIPLYILIILHGSSVVVQTPLFYVYFTGPAILFTIDKMISLSRKRTEISVIQAEKLPSDVTHLVFKRPPNFEYKSGQWVKIACLAQGRSEFHPFTLTSAPHEDTLSVHIRSLGPWTWNIRNTFDPEKLKDGPYPKLYVDGAYGAGQQDWYQFDVSILVGAGIGVTPYASILKDFVHMSAIKNTYKVKCHKLYFIWITGSQRHFEWLIDILREVEEIDVKGIVSIDIFITKFFQNFDLRTAMLYICEEHFQKLSGGRSVFTGLKATTHFGRPQLDKLMHAVHLTHPNTRKVGVFSCGPAGVTTSVERACMEASKSTKALFKHHFENF